jgi:hypothetical protein
LFFVLFFDVDIYDSKVHYSYTIISTLNAIWEKTKQQPDRHREIALKNARTTVLTFFSFFLIASVTGRHKD